jgi:hypothetical protein
MMPLPSPFHAVNPDQLFPGPPAPLAPPDVAPATPKEASPLTRRPPPPFSTTMANAADDVDPLDVHLDVSRRWPSKMRVLAGANGPAILNLRFGSGAKVFVEGLNGWRACGGGGGGGGGGNRGGGGGSRGGGNGNQNHHMANRHRRPQHPIGSSRPSAGEAKRHHDHRRHHQHQQHRRRRLSAPGFSRGGFNSAVPPPPMFLPPRMLAGQSWQSSSDHRRFGSNFQPLGQSFHGSPSRRPVTPDRSHRSSSTMSSCRAKKTLRWASVDEVEVHPSSSGRHSSAHSLAQAKKDGGKSWTFKEAKTTAGTTKLFSMDEDAFPVLAAATSRVGQGQMAAEE